VKVKTSKPITPTPKMTYGEWMAEGKKLFGDNFDNWRFVCPICGNVAAIADFKPFKDQGATPDTAANECIGRFIGSKYKAFGTSKEVGKPCDYALFGLFRLPGVLIAMPDGKERMAFAFEKAA
jgi:hypothetical protein